MSTLPFYEDKTLEDRFNNESTDELIEYIFSSFSKKVDENFIASLEVPYTANIAMLKISKMVELATVNHDGHLNSDEFLEKLDPDGEPYPNTIDSWARGTVSTKKIILDDKSNYRGGIPSAASNTPSVSSYRSSATGRSKTSGTKSRLGSSGKNGESLDKTGQIMEMDDDPDAEFGLNATGIMFDMLQKQKRVKEQGYVTKDTEKGEFDIIQEQIDKANKEMRGKKYVLDRYGKPVAVGKVNTETLPAFSLTLGLNVKTPEDELAAQKQANQGKDGDNNNADDESVGNGKDNKDGKKKKKFVRVAGSRSVEESNFKPNMSMATTLSGVESIQKIASGVTVKSNMATKSGSRIEEDPKRMSRKQYMIKTASMYSSSGGGLGEHSSIHSFSKSMDMDSLNGNNDHHHHMNSKSYGSGAGQQSIVSSNTYKSIDSMPNTFDPLEGGRKVKFESNVHDYSDEELGLGIKTTQGKIKLSTLPNKPSTKQQANMELLTGSPDNGKPRDRDLPKNMKPVSDRKHLPAPPSGEITGHGINLQKFQEKSTIMNDSTTSSNHWTQQWRIA